MNGNKVVACILGSPFYPILSGNTLLIEISGRKTGQKICLPVNYIRIGSDEFLVLSERNRLWWRILRSGAPVTLVQVGKKQEATAETVEAADVAEMLPEYLRQIPMARRVLGVE